MKKSMTMLKVVILMVCFASLMFVGAGCDNDYHHGRRGFRSRRDVYEVHREQDRCGPKNRHRDSRRRG